MKKVIIQGNRRFQILLLALIILITSSSALAWDGEREGFLLGIGVGVGFESYSGIEYDYVGLNSEDNSVFAITASPRGVSILVNVLGY